MKLEVSECDINVQGHTEKLKADRMWMAIGQQWHRLYAKYVPMDTGMLTNTVEFRAEKEVSGGSVSIKHVAPYAKHCYYGDKIRWRKTRHPLATAHWSQVAQAFEFPKLLQTVQNLIDNGYFEV